MEVPSDASSTFKGASTTNDGEIIKFPTSCSNCRQPAELVVQKAAIPHFQEVLLMCMVCDHCGFKTTEIKNSASTPVPTYATKITLLVRDVEDFNRDIVLSDSAAISLPDLELEQQAGGFEGVYTTVEGLLKKILSRLENATPFGSERTDHDLTQQRYAGFLRKLVSLVEGQHFPFKLVIEDQFSASHIGSRYGTKHSDTDAGLVIERRERSAETDQTTTLELPDTASGP